MTVQERVLALLRREPQPMRASVIAKRIFADPSAVWFALRDLHIAGLARKAGQSTWALVQDRDTTPNMTRALAEIRKPGDHTPESIASALGTTRRHALVTLRALVEHGLAVCEVSPENWRVRYWRPLALRAPDPGVRRGPASSRQTVVLGLIAAAPDGLTTLEICGLVGAPMSYVGPATRRLEAAGEIEADNTRLRARCLIWRASR